MYRSVYEYLLVSAFSSRDKDVKTYDSVMASKVGEDEESDEFAIKARWSRYHGTAWEAVDAAIDMLLELAAVVRKSTVSKRDSRVSPYFVRPDDAYFEEIAKLLVRSRFPDARRTLSDQLGTSIFTRRRRLLYQQRHEDKLAHPRPVPSSLDSEQGLVTSILEKKEQVARPTDYDRRQNPSALAQGNRTGPTPSDTELSKIHESLLNRRIKNPTTVSGRTSGSVSREEGQPGYPKHPPFQPGNKYCTCPYCSQPLPTAKLKTDSWRSVNIFPWLIALVIADLFKKTRRPRS
jgi:hypothetical protein